MLQILWNQLAYQGVLFVSNITEHKHIVLVNTLSLFIPVFTLFNLLTLISFGIPPIFLYGSIIYMFLLPISIVLNSNGKLLTARLYLFLLSLAYIFLISLLQGNQTRGHLFFLAEALVVYFVFPSYQRKLVHILVGILLILFSGFSFYHDHLVPLLILPPEKIKIAGLITDIAFAIILIGFSYYIHNTFQKTELYVQLEHEKSEKLLQNILPLSIIKKLRDNPDTIAERFENCTVLFSDIVGFTQMSKSMPAVAVVSLLNEIFSKFDDLAEKHNLEKIKTIGDAYMVVGGLPEPNEKHAENVAQFALEMLDVIREYRQKSNIPLELRIGINSGAAVAADSGKNNF